MTLLKGKIALITGASSGIGRAIALRFAAEGAAVVLTARGESRLMEVAGEISENGGRAIVSVGDVSQFATHERAVAAAHRAFGGLDIAVNNAGTVGPNLSLADMTLEDWNRTLAVNLTAAYLGARTQIGDARKRWRFYHFHL